MMREPTEGWIAYIAAARVKDRGWKAYQRYLHSPTWRRTREAALERAGHRCVLCESTKGLEVHHVTYVRLGAEEPGDLRVLCGTCHKRHHAGQDEGYIPLDATTRRQLEERALAAVTGAKSEPIPEHMRPRKRVKAVA